MKKILHNIYAFFYLSVNWNLWLAIFIFWHEAKRGPKYNINTIKPVGLKKLTIVDGDISKSLPYEAVSYYLLEKLLKQFRHLSGNTSLTDLGCGKGRVLVAAAHYGFTEVTGVEFAKELCEEAVKNLKKTNRKFPGLQWKVICSDVLNYSLEANESVFFLFNPFNKEILEKFLQKLKISVAQNPRTTWFIYASPLHADILTQSGYEVVFHIHPKMKLEGMILKKEF